MMNEQGNNENPYNTKDPAGNGYLFYGRDNIFPWIRAALARTLSDKDLYQPVILIGPPHIGKTSILKQIENGKLYPPYTALYLNLADMSDSSINEFLWEVAAAAWEQLQQHRINIPPLQQSKFVSDPLAAFREQLILPATIALKKTPSVATNGRSSSKLLFLFDNLHNLIPQKEANGGNVDLFQTLQNQIHINQLAACLFTYETNNGFLHEPFFGNAQIYEVGPLSTEATLDLVRQPVDYNIFKDVAEYIAALAQNKPYQTQLICRELYRRQQKLDLAFITVADVKAAHQAMKSSKQYGSDFDNPSPSFQINQRSNSLQTIHKKGEPAFWRDRRYLLALLLLLVLVVIFTAVPAFTGKTWSDQIADILGRNETPQVVVIVETPTPQPTVSSTSTPLPTTTNTPQPTASPQPAATAPAPPTNTATPRPTSLPEVLIRELDQMPMRLIPGGSFMMGSEDDDFMAGLDERPMHRVTLDTFYMDQFEVSVEQYTILLNKLGTYIDSCDGFDCASPRSYAGYTSFLVEEDLGDGTILYYALTGYGDYPMNHVSWYGAAAYCQFVGGRLPTEAEWEYAARGNDGRIYPWGDDPPTEERAVYRSLAFDNLKPVDALPEGASPFGIYGMAGSVWEWMADWYDESYYEESPIHNPTGPEAGIYKVIRGGSWPRNNERDRIRSANRNSLAPDFFSSTTGFRCAYDP